MRNCFSLVIIALLVPAISGCPGTDDMMMNGPPTGMAMTFTATLSGDQETPPLNVPGTGSGTFTLNAEQTELSYNVTATGLTGPATAAHFRNAPAGQAGGIVFDFGNTLSESNGVVTIQGTWSLTPSDVTQVLAGNIYVNIHTAQNPAGELRGQVQ